MHITFLTAFLQKCAVFGNIQFQRGHGDLAEINEFGAALIPTICEVLGGMYTCEENEG